MRTDRNVPQRPWYVALGFGLVVVAGVMLMPALIGADATEALARQPLSLIAGVIGLLMLVLIAAGVGVRDRTRTAPYVVLTFSLLVGGLLSLGPLANQSWSVAGSTVVKLIGAAAAVWLAVRVFRPGR